MEHRVINVEGMSCEHCVKAVTEATTELDGVHDVDVNLEAGTVTLDFDPDAVTLDEIKGTIEDQGYDVV
jgi:copper chaperone